MIKYGLLTEFFDGDDFGMIDILAKTNSTLKSLCTLPTGMHLTFCVIATLVYGLQYIRKKSLHYILLIIAFDLTFITQIYVSQTLLIVLAIAEIGLLTAAGVLSHKYNKEHSEEEPKSKSKGESAVESAFDD